MKIYTTYFARVRQLPSSIVPVAICLYPPDWWQGQTCRQLAPVQMIFQQYKASHDFEDFAQRYICTTLRSTTFPYSQNYLERCSEGKDVALVCYEKNPFECHRSIVAEWFKYNGVEVEEWHPEK